MKLVDFLDVKHTVCVVVQDALRTLSLLLLAVLIDLSTSATDKVPELVELL